MHAAMVEAARGQDVWLTGGGELVGVFAGHGLLDEIILGVAPVALGGGAPLLPRRLLSSQLHLTDVERVGQFAYLTYSVSHLCVPKTSSTSCAQAIFVDQTSNVSVFSDAVQVEVGGFG